MNYATFTIIITIFSVLLIFLFLYLVRVFAVQRKKLDSKDKDASQVGFVVDTFHELVTKLKEKERELEVLKRQAEERAHSIGLYNEHILQSVPSGVISFDQDLRITRMNSSAEKILDLKESDVIGRTYAEIRNSPISDIIEKRSTVQRAEVGYLTHSGKRIWLGLNISPLKDSANNTIGQILVFTDLTELRAFQSQKELRERLSTLGEMSAGIAHELRNPMAVISGYTKILLKKVDEASHPAVEAISREVAVMDRIIADFLSFAKPTEMMATQFDLGRLVESCLKGLEGRAKGIYVTNNTGGLPVIKADEVLLRQAVTNLIQNAVESMPEGGDLTARGFVDDALRLSISDTGHGIPKNIRDKIFLPFYTTKERGIGLGLSIVHKIVVSHGGAIEVQSGDKGTTFTITLPKDMIVNNPL
jgi:PAS domain S-box-containing protein